MTAKFEADSTFSIKGRGYVLSGWVRDGTAKIGMKVFFPSLQRKLTISGLELLTTINASKMAGLLFPYEKDVDLSIWGNMDVKGQVFDVSDD